MWSPLVDLQLGRKAYVSHVMRRVIYCVRKGFSRKFNDVPSCLLVLQHALLCNNYLVVR